MRFGLNLWGLNPYFLQDKEAFLERITKAGFRYLEPVLLLDEMPELKSHIWLPEDFKENGPLLQKYNVSIESIHVFSPDIYDDAERIIPLAKEYGIKQVVLPCPKFEAKEAYEGLAPYIGEAGDLFAEAGIDLVLHNGRDESKAQIDGISAFEWMIKNAGDNVYMEPDVGWLLYGGTDPEEFLWKYAKKIKVLHYKDMKKVENGYAETEIGTGEVDNVACFQFARANEIIQIADQDGSEGDFLEAMERVGGRLKMWSNARDNSKSILCVMDITTGEVKELKTFDRVIEAPNWYAKDDDVLFYNSEGFIYKYRISTGEEEKIESGICDNCNNDHVLKADGSAIAVSHSPRNSWMSQVYILPIEGGTPRLVTENAPSFLHGWSPDGKELAYCAFRDMETNFHVDIYTISENGGEERQLTQNAGFNDGPEYSPDGEYILFISTRSGLMQNWRMKRDGSEQTQLTFSERNNWFGHYSPDGKKIVYLSYSKDGLDPNEHLPNMNVSLSLMDADGDNDHVILEFFGGQGSINVNSWHPDSKKFAFVKYELMHK
ncbi:MAG: TIM barrel protein [Lachnospiraceae bacterium]|nr:TIM barrel protein [Lachnospiraceae bacterium]